MCGCDPYVSSIYTISVASCDFNGLVTDYSERCASIFITAYSGDKSTPYNVVSAIIYAFDLNFGNTQVLRKILNTFL